MEILAIDRSVDLDVSLSTIPSLKEGLIGVLSQKGAYSVTITDEDLILDTEAPPKHMEHIVAVSSKDVISKTDGTLNTMQEIDIENKSIFAAQRKMLEQNDDFKQIIPYIVVMDLDGNVGFYIRKGGNESRLDRSGAIGFGGHIDLKDVVYNAGVFDLKKTIVNAAVREVIEELDLGTNTFEMVVTDLKILVNKPEEFAAAKLKGEVIVESVHMGCLAFVIVDSKNVCAREEQIDFVGMIDVDRIKKYANLEFWTKEVIQHLFK